MMNDFQVCECSYSKSTILLLPLSFTVLPWFSIVRGFPPLSSRRDANLEIGSLLLFDLPRICICQQKFFGVNEKEAASGEGIYIFLRSAADENFKDIFLMLGN